MAATSVSIHRHSECPVVLHAPKQARHHCGHKPQLVSATRDLSTIRLVLLSEAFVLLVGCLPQAFGEEQARPQDEKYSWQSLFDGKMLKIWKVTKFGGEGQVDAKDGTIDSTK